MLSWEDKKRLMPVKQNLVSLHVCMDAPVREHTLKILKTQSRSALRT